MEDDLTFLEDQRGPRKGWMSGKDKIFEKKVSDKGIRDMKAEIALNKSKENQ